jgi:hypothetical protein
MIRAELARLELLAEIDALVDGLKDWADRAPAWQSARACRALVRRLIERTDLMRVRLEAPLVVATLGGTGTGKSALVNALVGAEVTTTGRARPTTQRPILICRPGLTPEALGIEPDTVELVERDLPTLREMVIVDCPDPDTTEEVEAAGSNLARLRQILPHCDVLLVAATQQKYRSARVEEELAAAAPGARLVFVQTHADVEPDIREDWHAVLAEQYTTGHLFFVDSLAALADAQNGLNPRGEFAALLDLLTRQLAGATALRIRRANFLDLLAETLTACDERIREGLPAIEQLRGAIEEQRARLSAQLAGQMRTELLASRRQWESRLVGKVASRWGLSPFALVLRLYQGLGGLLSSALLFRARTPAQVALWGAVEGARSLQRYRRSRRADSSAQRAVAGCWDAAELRAASIVLDGYLSEANLDRETAGLPTIMSEAATAGRDFVTDVSQQLESLLDRVAQRHTGWFTRWRYELLLVAVLGLLLYRPAKNFFYDSWLASPLQPIYGPSFYVVSLFWLVLWCALLLWAFTSRLRRGLRREINQLAERWTTAAPAAGLFVHAESSCAEVDHFRHGLDRLQQQVATLRRRLTLPDDRLGHLL